MLIGSVFTKSDSGLPAAIPLITESSAPVMLVIVSSFSYDASPLRLAHAAHSPKAGQGMNISMLDTHNLSWKINLVEKGIGRADVLLPSYEVERRSIAQRLIQFDSEYSKLFSGRNPKANQLTDEVEKAKQSGAVDPQRFIQVFKQNAQFTSGVGAIYSQPTALTALPDSDLVKNSVNGSAFNPQGSKLIPGHRLTPGKVTRVMDANIVRLQQEWVASRAFCSLLTIITPQDKDERRFPDLHHGRRAGAHF